MRLYGYKSFIEILVIILVPLRTFAQAYIPKVGEEFIFYPVSNALRDSIKGYDCFYSTDAAYRNEKYKLKPKSRFKADVNGLTPFSEIEGHIFTLQSSTVENKDEIKLEKRACVLFLTREDGEKLFLHVPYIRRKEDNKLTQAMTLYFRENGAAFNYKISIPCCPIKPFEEIKTLFSGQRIVSYYRSSTSLIKAKNLIEKQTEFMGGYVPQDLFDTRGHDLSCDSIGFCEVQSYSHMQPIAFCRYGDRKVEFPVFEYRGKGNAIYGDGYSILNLFERRENVYQNLSSRVSQPKILSMPGKRLRYDGTENAKLDYDKSKEIRCWNEDRIYFIKKQTSYLCERIDLSNEYADHFGLCAVMQDSLGKEFQIPIELLDLKEGSNAFTNQMFELEEEYLARVKAWREKKEAEEASLQETIAKYTVKYKDRDLATHLAIYKNEERYLKLRKKYGSRKAGLMIRKLYEIGWSFLEVKESIEDDYFELIHTYEDLSGYYSQYQHRKYAPSYLLFHDGVLDSISD